MPEPYPGGAAGPMTQQETLADIAHRNNAALRQITQRLAALARRALAPMAPADLPDIEPVEPPGPPPILENTLLAQARGIEHMRDIILALERIA